MLWLELIVVLAIISSPALAASGSRTMAAAGSHSCWSLRLSAAPPLPAGRCVIAMSLPW